MWFGRSSGSEDLGSVPIPNQSYSSAAHIELVRPTAVQNRFSLLKQQVIRYTIRLGCLWLLLVGISFQSAHIQTNSVPLDPIDAVMCALSTEAESYELLLWTERRVPTRYSQFGGLKKLVENIAYPMGLESGSITYNAETTDQTWSYRLSGRRDNEWVDVMAAWISPDVVTGNNQVTAIRIKGNAYSELANFRRQLERSLARTTGRFPRAKIVVNGRFGNKGDIWELVTKVRRQLSCPPFSGLNTNLILSTDDGKVMYPPGETVTAIEGKADVLGRRQISFSIFWSKEKASGVVRTELSPQLESEKLVTLTYLGNKWAQ